MVLRKVFSTAPDPSAQFVTDMSKACSVPSPWPMEPSAVTDAIIGKGATTRTSNAGTGLPEAKWPLEPFTITPMAFSRK